MLENQQSNSFLIRCKHNYINIHQKLGTLDLCNLIPTLCKHKNKSSGRMMEMLNFCSQIALYGSHKHTNYHKRMDFFYLHSLIYFNRNGMNNLLHEKLGRQGLYINFSSMDKHIHRYYL